MTTVRDAVAQVVDRNACSGCGLCPLLDRGLVMRLDVNGYSRPIAGSDPDEIDGAIAVFRRSCPGLRVRANDVRGAARHPLLGSYISAWEAWAADDELRFAGSSGGTLSALSAWLISTGRASRVAMAAADPEAPRRTVPVTITSRAEALAATGSRYAPVSTLYNPDVRLRKTAIVAKPCEISAVRAAGDAVTDGDPILLSFFCAGTPSQWGTDQLLNSLGVDVHAQVDSLRYRGRGWPGRFTARTDDRVVDADYEESWGSVLGPSTQWRCKMCADGVGESADIVAADLWATDDRGYPVFAEGPGVSALIARTPRGHDLLLEAVAEGAIVARPLAITDLALCQPLQTDRRRFLLGRLWGSRMAGRTPPRYVGFRLLGLGLRHPRRLVRVIRGTFRRVRATKDGP